jgi:hypothetical protein
MNKLINVFIFVVIGVVLLSVVGDFANNLTREGVEAEYVLVEIGKEMVLSSDMTWKFKTDEVYGGFEIKDNTLPDGLVGLYFESGSGMTQTGRWSIWNVYKPYSDELIYEGLPTNEEFQEIDFSFSGTPGIYTVSNFVDGINFLRDNTQAIQAGQFHDTTIGTLITLLPVLYIIILVTGAVGYVVVSKKN